MLSISLHSSTITMKVMEDWIQWFCRSDGHDFFCEIDRSYIGPYYKNTLHFLFYFVHFIYSFRFHSLWIIFLTESRFNLYGLSAEVDDFTHCCETILDYVSDESEGGMFFANHHRLCVFWFFIA